MKKIFAIIAVAVSFCGCGHNSLQGGYVLDRVIEVAGRQGVACDGEYYYVSGSTALYKYTLDGQLVASNESPFEGLELAANHIGDIDVHDGEIYAGIETFMDGVGTNIQAAVYSAADLKWKRSVSWVPESGQVEVCGLAVDAARGKLYMADWVNGSYLYRYNLASGGYECRIALDPAPALQQGVAVYGQDLVISADDGDAEKEEHDHLYRISADEAASADGMQACAATSLFRTMDDFRRVGEIEGLCFNRRSGDMIVLSNRGSRIILGMPKGFYPGYDREIHEIFVYKRR